MGTIGTQPGARGRAQVRRLLLGIGVALLPGLLLLEWQPGSWYGHVLKPAWAPGDYWFQELWLLLLAASGLGAAGAPRPIRLGALSVGGLGWWLLVLQGVAAAVWLHLLFGLREPGAATVAAGALLLAALGLALVLVAPAAKGRWAAAALQGPYLLWCAATFLLTRELARLNLLPGAA